MSEFLEKLLALVSSNEVLISEHGYDELANDDILASEVINGLTNGEIIEEYPNFPKGPCALILQSDSEGKPPHTVWGIPSGAMSPAVLVTAYRPDPERWTSDFRKRN